MLFNAVMTVLILTAATFVFMALFYVFHGGKDLEVPPGAIDPEPQQFDLLDQHQAADYLDTSLEYSNKLLDVLMVPYTYSNHHSKLYISTDLELVKKRLKSIRDSGQWNL